MKDIYLSTQTTLIITLGVGAFFIALGYVNLKKVSDNKSYIIGDRNESIFSLSLSIAFSTALKKTGDLKTLEMCEPI